MAPRPPIAIRSRRLLVALLGVGMLGGLFAPAAVLAAQPTVTINQAAGQADPTGTSPINFTVVFSEAVTGFVTGDVNLSGTAGATTATVTGTGTTYNVAVSGMTGPGSVIADVPAGVAINAGLETNLASTSLDNTVEWDNVAPTVTINQAVAQADPTSVSPINFTVVFSEAVSGFATGDVAISGTAGGTKTATVSGAGPTYNVAVTGMVSSGTVIATIAAGVAIDAAGNSNAASTSTDNSVAWVDATPPTVTIEQAAGQADPTGVSPINFTVIFSEAVTGFATGDVVLTGSAGATTATVTGSGTNYSVAVTGMTSNGTVIASINAGVATDAAGNPNDASTSSDHTVTYNTAGPSVTINQASGQADPTFTSPINFTVVFSSAVTGFTTGDVLLSGTAGATTATVTGSGTNYTVAVSGMTTTGTVTATVPPDVALDGSNRPNHASTFTDNTVTWAPGPSVTINQATGQADPTGTSPINFTVVFGSSVTGFATGDVTLSGTAGATTAVVTGTGTTYNVAVSGMTTTGTVIATVAAAVAVDASARPNVASTSTDNVVTWAPGGPTVTVNQATGQGDPTNASPINFTVVFSAAVTGFSSSDVVISGTSGGAKTATVTGSGTTYNVAVSGMTTVGTVVATVPADIALDGSSRPNRASTSTDNTVTWSPVPTSITLTTSAPIPPGAHNPVILWGQGFTLGVQFGANGAGKQVQLQAQRDGVTWNTIATLTMDSSGHASFFYTPVTNLYYRAVFAGTPDLAAGNSNLVRTVVRELALLRPTNNGATKTINRNTSITFSTTVRPARPELAPATVSFYFYRLTGGSYHLVTTRDVVIDSAGVAKTTFKFTISGKWYVRSQANPTAYNANSVMTLEKYSVR